MTIVGVAQKGFVSEMPGSEPQLFVPLAMKKEMTPDWDGLDDRLDYWVTMFGRLTPGETLQQAQTAINITFQPQLLQDIALLTKKSEETLKTYRAKTLVLRPGTYGRGNLREQGKQPLFLLLAMTSLVLLIACANVANLQLTRALARTRETAVRLALGASRRQLAGQLLLESAVIAVSGAVLGLFVAYGTLRGVLAALPPRTLGPNVLAASLNLEMMAFALALAAVTSLAFGLYPALHASRAQLTLALRDQNGQATASRSTGIFRKSLVTLQTAVSLLLLVSAGLFGRTLVNLTHVDLGIRVDHLITFSVSPKLNGYDDARTAQMYHDVRERLAALPGVISATSSRVPAIANSSSSGNMTVEGFTPKGERDDNSHFNEVGPDYFRTMGIPLVAGREIVESDTAAAPKVAVVNEAFVRHFIPDRNPIGVQVMRGSDTKIKYDTTIVGVVRDAVYSNMREPPVPVYYSVSAQSRLQRGNAYFYVRTAGDPLQVAGAIRSAVASLDPNLPVTRLADNGGAARFQRGERAPAVDPDRELRRIGDAAGGDRAVRRSRVQRRAADARDRDPHGARRERAPGARPGRARDSVHHRHRTGRGTGRGVVRGPADPVGAVSHGTCRSPGLRRRGDPARADRDGGGIRAGAPGHQRGSHDRPAIRVGVGRAVGMTAAMAPPRRGLAVQPTEALRDE